MAWTDRYVSASASGFDNGTSESAPWTLQQAASGTTAGMRVNIKAGTYTLTTNLNITTTQSGTATDAVWWRGYKTTVGDLDEKFTGDKTAGTDIPTILTTDFGYFFINGTDFFHMSGLDFKSESANYSAIYDRADYSWRKNCRFYHSVQTTNEANDQAGTNKTYINCEFSGQSASSTVYQLTDASNYSTYINCVFYGITPNSWNGVTTSTVLNAFIGCVFQNMRTAITANGVVLVKNCTFVDISDTAIQFASTNIVCGSVVANNIFHDVTNYAIGSGSVNEGVMVYNNLYKSVGTRFQNMGDMPEFDGMAEVAASSFENKAIGNYQLASDSTGIGVGLGGFWPYPMSDFSDVGAAQSEATSGGGGIKPVSFNGGMNG